MYICNQKAELHNMMIPRTLQAHLKKMLEKFPIVSVTGPRQAGKTTLLRETFPDYTYYNLERLDHRELLKADPLGFLRQAGDKVIFDEAQRVPELFPYIQVLSDETGKTGQYILSGSQSFLLNERISQSLAGRVSVQNLFPFTMNELKNSGDSSVASLILNGFYPRLYDKHILAEDYYPSYLQTYIERDVRTLRSIENLNTFTRFLGLCAGRVGQVLNITSLANDSGVVVNTAKSWLSLLEASYIIFLLQPYHRNFNKRMIKSPKLYFYDTGVVSSLLRITNTETLRTHYAFGSLFENLVISDLIKHQSHRGMRPSHYYWRDSNGVEVDSIIDLGNNEVLALEIKAGETFNPDYLKNLRKLKSSKELKIKKALLYLGDTSSEISDISIVSWKDYHLHIVDMATQ